MNPSAKKKTRLKIESEMKEQKKKSSLNKKSIENILEINSTFFDNSLDAMMIGSQDGRIYAANPAACRMLGFSEKEICKLGRKGIVEQTLQLKVAVSKRRETGNFFGELTFIKKDETPFPVEISSSVFKSLDGREFTTLIIRDITELKKSELALLKSEENYRLIYDNAVAEIAKRNKAEEELHKSEEKFRMLTEKSVVGFYIIQDEKFVYTNSTSAYLLGYLPEEIIGRLSPKDIIHPDDINIMLRRIQERLDGIIEKKNLVYKAVKKDGSLIFIEVYGMATDYQGRPAVMGSIVDITERLNAEEKLRRSEEEYRSLFENSIMGISQAEPGGKFIRMNKAYAEMYGYSDPSTMIRELAQGSKMLYTNPKDRKKVLELLDKYGFIGPTEFELNRRNGEKFWALVSAMQVRDNAGKLLYLQAEHINITNQKIMEGELRKSKEMLEKLNQHLVEVRENERNQIALNLHDDLGQKLTAINLDIAWLKSRIGVQSKSVRQKFEEMSSMIKETVESIRETSSLLRPAILFDLGIVAAIKSQLGSFEKQTGIKCHFYFELEELDLEDRLALILYRILQESLTNIARHSGASATEIELVILKNKIEMIIEDNGKGIAKDKVNSLESMGIAGMKERVKSANGKIVIRGEPGAGTSIKVIIPLKREKDDD